MKLIINKETKEVIYNGDYAEYVGENIFVGDIYFCSSGTLEIVEVDELPEVEEIEGKRSIIYCNPDTKELWHEYKDIPKTQEELQADTINTLGQELAVLKIQLIMGGIL